ncbi:hypothetical protein ACFPK5_09235 [Streptomyces beijiangensis]
MARGATGHRTFRAPLLRLPRRPEPPGTLGDGTRTTHRRAVVVA